MSVLRCIVPILLWLTFLSPVYIIAQPQSYPEAVEQAIAWRQNQNAAHVILWNNYHYELNEDSFSVDQKRGLYELFTPGKIIRFRISILGTYNHPDSTFLWSIENKSVQRSNNNPVAGLMEEAGKRYWPLPKNGLIHCSFDSAYNLASLAAYLGKTNGMGHVMTNRGKTNVLFAYYEITIHDRKTNRVLQTIPVKQQYQLVNAPDLINHCRLYVTVFGKNEKKYQDLYQGINNKLYLDTLFRNRVIISDQYWDTTSTQYVFFRRNRLQAYFLDSIVNWRVIDINGNRYVLYDEKTNRNYSTWGFLICPANVEPRICNEYQCF